ncbi:MAG: O-antigen ligase family protein, partial [Candidatus Nanopelagicales bacterium]
MFREATMKRAGVLVSLSVFFVTVVVTPDFTLDPINVPKLWFLLAFSFAISFVLLLEIRNLFQKSNWSVIIPARLLSVAMLVALLVTGAPLAQQIFGTYGRNTGFLTYFAFGTLFIASALATNWSMAKYFMVAVGAALGANAIYGFFQAIGSDPFKWSNPYSPVIGTLGNPNFAAAFLGMGIAFALPFAISKSTNIKYRLISAAYIPLALFDITRSDAQQGLIVSALSVGLVGFFWIRSKFPNPIIRYSYLGAGGIVAFIAVLGTLQKGPLSSLLYKPSVTYRGDYWYAGIEMIKNFPLFGVGLDSYRDWYRASRTEAATLRRGPDTVSNAAHNVFLDIGATAGVVALLA